MEKNLVIVESPAKAKTLGKFLGTDYEVMSSYGHIRDLKSHSMGVNLKDFTPEYEIPDDKQDVVRKLKKAAKAASTVWLASDEDREGEAISWHLAQVLGLSVEDTKRIVFHEITKPAILKAIETPRHIDLNLVNAQQARRVLDRIVGFKLSPILWHKLKPGLSAGRVQSVAVRLIVEREREIQSFNSQGYYRVVAEFRDTTGRATLTAELNRRLATLDEARHFLETIDGQLFTIADVSHKPLTRTPAPPFTTSTLQQEAARKLGFPVSLTMQVAQRLYEEGKITYMRTDSLNLSTLCVNACKAEISAQMGEEYARPRAFHTHTKGAQEAHEAIRPTSMKAHVIKGTEQERKLYELIWKRTIASQMADAQLEKTTVDIDSPQLQKDGLSFVATSERVLFDGFLRVYLEGRDDEDSEARSLTDNDSQLTTTAWAAGQPLAYSQMTAQERFSQHPPRYTEASLVKKMEELGIGRPSTYAPTISTIQQRGYVERGNTEGTPCSVHTLTLTPGHQPEATEKEEELGRDRGKLLPTDMGIVVNDFLVEKFPEVVDLNFTANVELEFDQIAEGKENWQNGISDFYQRLEPLCQQVLSEKTDTKTGERLLGTDPATGRTVSVKIGRFGPMAQMGRRDDEEKPRFAALRPGQSIHTITLEEALDLFKLPRQLGDYEGATVTVGVGRFGPYVQHNKLYVSIPRDTDPCGISLDEAIQLIEAKRQDEANRHIKSFDEEPELEILKGRFGAYIKYKGKNYKLTTPKGTDPTSVSLEQCLEMVAAQDAAPKKKRTSTTSRRAKK